MGKHVEGYHKKWRENNPDKMVVYNKRANAKRPTEEVRRYNNNRKHKTPEKWLLWIARARAKKNGIEFNITEQDIKIPERCPILDIPIAPTDGKVSNSSLSLDRIDPGLGYVPGNVAVISHKANNMKRDMTLEQLRRLLKYMEKEGVS